MSTPSAHAREVLARFEALDAMLVRAGFPAASPWWRGEIRRFYRSGRRRWALRKGRRAGGSSTLCRLAYVEARWGKHAVPPGDVGFVMFISRDRDEAAQRLRTIKAIAEVVGDRLEERGDELLIRGRRTGFKVFTATIAGVSGPTCVMVIGDEVAKWADSDTGANPATEVIASAMPTIATQPEARAIWCSSPMGTDDAHARMVDAGDTEHQIASTVPTWVANPTISEAQTHELEPDERVWRREYAAEPQAGALAAFDEAAIDRAIGRPFEVAESGRCVLVIDASSGRKDAWTWAIARRVLTPDVRRLVVVDEVDGVEGKFWQTLGAETIVRRLAGLARRNGITRVHSDQREAYALSGLFRQHGLALISHDWTAKSKQDAVEAVRGWLRDDVLVLPKHDKLRRELVRFEERIAPSGSFTFGARGSGHDDYAALLLTLAMVQLEGQLPRAGGPRTSGLGGAGPPVDVDQIETGF